ncbi:MAG TPA: BTAD domain-containing putative transcriptional regulator [Thermomicrobiaceae bacterium]|nr:BTAD domain-containing putative transcriptional regulator [Thermomicrobiaceae bacterium]
MEPLASFAIALLGTFQVQAHGVFVTRFRGDKVRALLAYLAVESDRPHTRAALTGLLWPELPDEHALRNLSQALIRLREGLGVSPGGDDDPLQVTRQAVQWRGVAAEVDVAAFTRLASGHELSDLERAVALYRGAFLAGFALPDCEAFEEWLLVTREGLQEQMLAALQALAEHHLAAGHAVDAAEAARRQLALDPWREAGHRQLMRALAAAGDRAGALAAYAHCREVLRAELDAAPDEETRRLAAQIETGELAFSAAAPASASTSARAHNLPAPLASLVGREAELARLKILFDDEAAVRLMTVTGAGGVGKTRLALAAAWALVPRFADGVWWVELAGQQPAADLALGAAAQAGAVAAALGLTLAGSRPPVEALADALREREALLVLDNCEHLPAVPRVVHAILSTAPGLRVLATSRAPLELHDETLLRLAGLPVPPEDAPDAAALASYAGVRLFLERAERLAPGWGQEPDELAGAARLCRLLDGIPLGIELAAHWVGHFSPDEIAAALRRNPALLAARTPDVPERQRSLRAVFDYTWRLLQPAEQRALARLSVFRGGFDRAAAQAVGGVRATTLVSLADKSLLRHAGPGRYSLHELLRQFAAERLEARGELDATRDQHRDWCLELAERVAPDLINPEQATRLEREQDNLRAALQWTIGRRDVESALRLGIGDGVYWYLKGQFAEGRAWLGQILGLAAPPHLAALHSRALSYAGHLAYCEGDLSTAEALLSDAAARAEQAGDIESLGYSALFLGHVARARGARTEAEQWYDQSLRLARQPGGRSWDTLVLSALARLRYESGDFAGAGAAADEALELCAVRDDPSNRARALAIRSRLAALAHEDALADALLADCLQVHQRLRSPRELAHAHLLAVDTALDRCRPVEAARHLDEVLRLAAQTHDQLALARGLEGVAELLASTELEVALQLVGVASGIRGASGLALVPIEQSRLERWLAGAREVLSDERVERLRQLGRERPVHEALGRARAACAALAGARAPDQAASPSTVARSTTPPTLNPTPSPRPA